MANKTEKVIITEIFARNLNSSNLDPDLFQDPASVFGDITVAIGCENTIENGHRVYQVWEECMRRGNEPHQGVAGVSESDQPLIEDPLNPHKNTEDFGTDEVSVSDNKLAKVGRKLKYNMKKHEPPQKLSDTLSERRRTRSADVDKAELPRLRLPKTPRPGREIRKTARYSPSFETGKTQEENPEGHFELAVKTNVSSVRRRIFGSRSKHWSKYRHGLPAKTDLSSTTVNVGQRSPVGHSSVSTGKSETKPSANTNWEIPADAAVSDHKWKVGDKLEAKDYMKKWYPAKIVDVDEKSGKVLIHFEGWNQRYDEWLKADSGRIRPLTHISPQPDKPAIPVRNAGEKVLARWTDGFMYPGVIAAVVPSGSYMIQFYDGLKKLVQPSNVEALPNKMLAECKSRGITLEVIKGTSRRSKDSKRNLSLDTSSSFDDAADTSAPSAECSIGNNKEHDEILESSVENMAEGFETDKPNSVHVDIATKLSPSSEYADSDDTLEYDESLTQELFAADTVSKTTAQKHTTSGGLETEAIVSISDVMKKTVLNQAENSKGLETQKPAPTGECLKDIETATLKLAPSGECVGDVITKDCVVSLDCCPAAEKLSRVTTRYRGVTRSFGGNQRVIMSVVGNRGLSRSTKGQSTVTRSTAEREGLSRLVGGEKVLEGEGLRCNRVGCGKRFRNEVLLDYHIKYFHSVAMEHRAQQSGVRAAGVDGGATRRRRKTGESSGEEWMAESSRYAGKRRRTVSGHSIQSHIYTDQSTVSHIYAESAENLSRKLVNCSCGSRSEAFSCIQCSVCLCWQHVKCLPTGSLPSILQSKTALVKHAHESENLTTGVKSAEASDLKQTPEYPTSAIKSKNSTTTETKTQATIVATGGLQLGETETKVATKPTENVLIMEVVENKSTTEATKTELATEATKSELPADATKTKSATEATKTESTVEATKTELETESMEENTLTKDKTELSTKTTIDEALARISLDETKSEHESQTLNDDDEPYVCYMCRHPAGIRSGSRHIYDRSWFTRGRLPSFSFLPADYNNRQIIRSTHNLVSDLHGVEDVLRSVDRKLFILKNKNCAEISMWGTDNQSETKNNVVGVAMDNVSQLETSNSNVGVALETISKSQMGNTAVGVDLEKDNQSQTSSSNVGVAFENKNQSQLSSIDLKVTDVEKKVLFCNQQEDKITVDNQSTADINLEMSTIDLDESEKLLQSDITKDVSIEYNTIPNQSKTDSISTENFDQSDEDNTISNNQSETTMSYAERKLMEDIAKNQDQVELRLKYIERCIEELERQQGLDGRDLDLKSEDEVNSENFDSEIEKLHNMIGDLVNVNSFWANIQ